MQASVRRSLWIPFALLMGFFSLLSLPVVLSGAGGTSEAADAVGYHLPVIERMRDDWPRVDVAHYESATTPGFHLLMAAVWRASGDERAMTAVNWCFGAGLIAAVFVFVRRHAGPWAAAVLTLPLACSPYVLGASIWLTTDNAAMLCMVVALGLALSARLGGGRLLGGGVAAGAAVAIRQMNVWLAAPLAFAGLIASPMARAVPRELRRDGSAGEAPSRRWASAGFGLVAAAIPALVLVFFMWKWGWRLTPATDSFEIQKHNAGPNWASPAFALALTGALGVFFVPLAWGRVRKLRLDVTTGLVVLAALAAAVATPTSHLSVARSYGWLWRIVEKFPAVMDRSIVITAAAPFGALVLLVMHRAACDAGRRTQAGLLLLSMSGWLAAQTMNSMAWQRYFEPMVMLGLIWLGAMTMTTESTPIPQSRNRWHMVGPMALAACQLTLGAITLYREVLADFGR